MKRIAIGVLALLGAITAAPVMAMTFMKVDYVCPIGGEHFSAETMGSGTVFGHYLDGRQDGAIRSPWPLVQCPGNGFVLFERDFSKEELEKLTLFVEGAEYQRMRASETSYWLLAQLLNVIGVPAENYAGVLQQATWQASAEQYPRYVAAASAVFSRQCPDTQADIDRNEAWLYCQMLLGEWERRLSHFDQARERFMRLQPLPATLVVAADRAQYEVEIAQQLKLIEAGNAAPVMADDAAEKSWKKDTATAAGLAGSSADAMSEVEQTGADAAARAAEAAGRAAANAANEVKNSNNGR